MTQEQNLSALSEQLKNGIDIHKVMQMLPHAFHFCSLTGY
jgi:hypothetical protein